jgi:dTMP kinase
MSASGAGVFITFEGGEGSGKTTQIARLAAALDARFVGRVVITREPGGTGGAEQIRDLLVNGAASRWQPATEALMMSAARHEHVTDVIRPALARGDIVLCDRFIDSTHVYQGFVGGVDIALLTALDRLSCGGLMPHLTFFLDIDSDLGLARVKVRGAGENRFETKGAVFHEQVRQGFIHCATRAPDRIITIDASRSEEVVAADIASAIEPLLKRQGHG